MRKFAGNKPTEVILALCKAEGVAVNMKEYDSGGDWLHLESPGAFVSYNTANGRFTGTTPDRVAFDSNETTHEGEWWFQKLLEFFYEPLPDVPVSPFANIPVALDPEHKSPEDLDAQQNPGSRDNDEGRLGAHSYAAAAIVGAPEVVKPAADLAPATYPDPFKAV